MRKPPLSAATLFSSPHLRRGNLWVSYLSHQSGSRWRSQSRAGGGQTAPTREGSREITQNLIMWLIMRHVVFELATCACPRWRLLSQNTSKFGYQEAGLSYCLRVFFFSYFFQEVRDHRVRLKCSPLLTLNQQLLVNVTAFQRRCVSQYWWSPFLFVEGARRF